MQPQTNIFARRPRSLLTNLSRKEFLFVLTSLGCVVYLFAYGRRMRLVGFLSSQSLVLKDAMIVTNSKNSPPPKTERQLARSSYDWRIASNKLFIPLLRISPYILILMSSKPGSVVSSSGLVEARWQPGLSTEADIHVSTIRPPPAHALCGRQKYRTRRGSDRDRETKRHTYSDTASVRQLQKTERHIKG